MQLLTALIFNLVFMNPGGNLQGGFQQDHGYYYFEIDRDFYELISYYNNGKIKERGYMHNGKATGCWQAYNEDGSLLATATYLNGKKDGIWKIYSCEGELKYSIEYKDNHKMVAKEFAIASSRSLSK